MLRRTRLVRHASWCFSSLQAIGDEARMLTGASSLILFVQLGAFHGALEVSPIRPA